MGNPGIALRTWIAGYAEMILTFMNTPAADFANVYSG